MHPGVEPSSADEFGDLFPESDPVRWHAVERPLSLDDIDALERTLQVPLRPFERKPIFHVARALDGRVLGVVTVVAAGPDLQLAVAIDVAGHIAGIEIYRGPRQHPRGGALRDFEGLGLLDVRRLRRSGRGLLDARTYWVDPVHKAISLAAAALGRPEVRAVALGRR